MTMMAAMMMIVIMDNGAVLMGTRDIHAIERAFPLSTARARFHSLCFCTGDIISIYASLREIDRANYAKA